MSRIHGEKVSIPQGRVREGILVFLCVSTSSVEPFPEWLRMSTAEVDE